MWDKTDSGETIGDKGCEGGLIVRDEEHRGGARITIEKGGEVAPFTIVSGIYGCFFHTTYLSTEDEAKQHFEVMKEEISGFLSSSMPKDKSYDWIESFVGRH